MSDMPEFIIFKENKFGGLSLCDWDDPSAVKFIRADKAIPAEDVKALVAALDKMYRYFGIDEDSDFWNPELVLVCKSAKKALSTFKQKYGDL